MPYVQPSRGDVHIDRALTNISIAFIQSAEGFVARRVFPEIPVTNQSNKYFEFDRGEWNRNQMRQRAPGTEAPSATMKISTDSYLCDVFDLGRDVPDEIRANTDSPLNPDREAAEFLGGQALINLEVNWATAFFQALNPGDIWTFDVDGDATPSTAALFDPTDADNNQKRFWDDSDSTPIEDVRQGKRFVGESTGFRPNKLTMGRAVFDTLLDHPDIIGRIDRGQTTGPAIAARASLAALFELDEILVMDAIQNTAQENLVSDHSFIGGRHALLSFSPRTPGLMTPSAGYTFRWTGIDRSVPDGAEVTMIREDRKHNDFFEIMTSYDQKLVGADLGYFFGDIVEFG